MKQHVKNLASVAIAVAVLAWCGEARADLAGKTASSNTSTWNTDPNTNAPFYESENLTSLTVDGQPSAGGNAVNTVLSETFTITNGAGGLSGIGGSTNHTLTGIGVVISGYSTTPMSLHLFDVTTNLTSNNGSTLNGSGASYGFTNNGDLLGAGKGLTWTNNSLSGAPQQEYFALGNGPGTDDQVILATNHTYTIEMWTPVSGGGFNWLKDSVADSGGEAMGSHDSSFTVSRLTIATLGQVGGAPRTFALALYGYATNAPGSVNTNLVPVTNTYPPPKLTISKAIPALRMFAGSGSVSSRQELATQDQNQSWVGASSPVSYSFTIAGGNAQTNYFQTHLFLIPVNTIPGGAAGSGAGTGEYNNGYADYQASNLLWLQINGTNGSSTVSANISWKTNNPNNNPTNVTELTIQNSTIVGTWTLTFTDNSHGSLTAPGAAPAPFRMTDPNVATDFANPVVAYIGVQANTSGAQGDYEDFSQISITGVSGSSEVDNFTTDTSINPGLWQVNPNSASTSLILATSETPLWISWPSLGAASFGLGVTPTLPVTATPGNTGGFVLPESYNGYYDVPNTNNEGGGTIWALIPSDCLPSYANPAQTNAFFELVNPPPAN